MKKLLLFLGFSILTGCNLGTGLESKRYDDTEINALLYTIPSPNNTDLTATAVVISSDFRIDTLITISKLDSIPGFRQLFYSTVRESQYGYSVVRREKKEHNLFYDELKSGILIKVKDWLICFDRNAYEYTRFAQQSKINLGTLYSPGDTVLYVVNNDTLNAVLLEE